MSNSATIQGRITQAFSLPSHGVLGLVDELLAVSVEHGIRVAWIDGRCHVQLLEDGRPVMFDLPMSKSVVRAALARLAVLCNEQRPDSVLPYGGQTDVTIGSDQTKAVGVKFVNTSDEQSLELSPAKSGSALLDPVGSVAKLVENRQTLTSDNPA